MNTDDELIDGFLGFVQGELNDSSLGFLRSLTKSNPVGFQKLLVKFQQLQLHLNNEQVDFVINALTEQLALPHQTMSTIKQFIESENKHKKIEELHTLSLQNSSTINQSVEYIMNNLSLFPTNTTENQFIRVLISIMIQWNEDHDERNCLGAAKWLKSILQIPHKTEMAQIIKLMSYHLYLSKITIDGDVRQSDGLELFFLLENITTDTGIVLVSELNKKMMKSLHAVMISVFICKHSPHAFYDLILTHKSNTLSEHLSSLYTNKESNQYLTSFFQNEAFVPYFQTHEIEEKANEYIFLDTLAQYIDEVLTSKDPVIMKKVAKITHFMNLSRTQYHQDNVDDFTTWFENGCTEQELEPVFKSKVLETIHSSIISKKSYTSGRMRSSALQLVSLGFSHRSASAQAMGTFQPLVHTDMARINEQNIKSVMDFFEQQSPEIRVKLTKEILLLTLVNNQKKVIAQEDTNRIRFNSNEILANIPKNSPTIPKINREGFTHRERLFAMKNASKITKDVRVLPGLAPRM